MYAIQTLISADRRALARWKTVATAKRLATAEKILASVRMDRANVQTLSRIKPFNGDLCRAYHLAGG